MDIIDSSRQNARFRGKVRAVAKKERLPIQDDGWKLNRAPALDQDLTLDGFPDKVLNDLLDKVLDGKRIYKRDNWLRALAVLLANLSTDKPVHISLDSNHYNVPSRYRRLPDCVRTLVDLLHEGGYIAMKEGFQGRYLSRRTRIWATRALMDEIPCLLPHIIRLPGELVILRKAPVTKLTTKKQWNPRTKKTETETVKYRIPGDLLPYDDTAKTNRIRSILQKANEVNSSAQIRYYAGNGVAYRVNPCLKAIFIERFTQYGRLHTTGFAHHVRLDKEEEWVSHQQIPKAIRESIYVDRQQVVELDYSGLHPRLLYASKGIQYDDDPYAAVINHLVDPQQLKSAVDHCRLMNPQEEDIGQVLRGYLKEALLALLNAKDYVSAQAASNLWLYTRPLGLLDIHRLGITKAKPVLDAFMTVHQPIADHFLGGKQNGLQIMNLDSRIALDVVNHFARQNIVVLPVHDSFLVQARHRDELRTVMADTYAKHTGGFRCPIK